MSQNNNNNQSGNGGRHPFLSWIAQHMVAIAMAIVAAMGSYYALKEEVKVNSVQIQQNKEDIKQVRIESVDQAKKNEEAINGLSTRIDTLIFKLADLQAKK